MVESVVFSSAPTPAVAPAIVAVATDRPAWLPENFATPEAFVTSYKELQAKVTAKGQEAPAPTPEEKLAADEKAAALKVAADAGKTPDQIASEKVAADKATAELEAGEKLKAAGIDYTALQDKFMEKGAIDEADYAQLLSLGFSKEVVLAHIADKVASADALRAETMVMAGGEPQFAAMSTWARTAYTPAQIAAYNKSVDSGDAVQMQQAVKALRVDYEKVKGIVPSLLKSTTVNAAIGDHYESMAQMLADQSNPLYKSDPAFRAKVSAKLGRSKI